MIESLNTISDEKLLEIDAAKPEYSKEVIEIEGIVSPESQGGYPHNGFSVHMFKLSIWNEVGKGNLIDENLLILRPVDSSKDYFKDVPKYAIVNILVYLSRRKNRAIFIKGKQIQEPKDPRLKPFLNELKKPIEKQSDYFGKLIFDKSINWYRVKKEFNGKTIRLNFSPDEYKEIAKGLNTAMKVWENIESWDKRVKEYAMKEMLEIKNESWIENDDEKVTGEEFKNLMSLSSISFRNDGEFEFWYDDGDLFWGHSIYSQCNLREGVIDVAF